MLNQKKLMSYRVKKKKKGEARILVDDCGVLGVLGWITEVTQDNPGAKSKDHCLGVNV